MMAVLPLRKTDPPPAKTKFAGFDAVRAGATLGVVLLHSCVPYLRYPMPGLVWPVRDANSSLVDFTFWSIELFIMPLFLAMAGYFAWQTLQSRGSTTLIKSRARRLLVPLLFGILFVIPLDLYCWAIGWVAEGLIAPVKLRSLKFDGTIGQNMWGLSHLWFLQYLFLYVVTVALAARVRERWPRWKRFEPSPRVLIALVVMLGSLVLYLRPEVVWGFQHSFVPFPSKWIYSGLFFVIGAMLAAYDGQLLWLKSMANRLVAPACLTAVAAILLGRWHLGGGDQQLAVTMLAVLTCTSALLLTLSILGIAVKRIQRVPTVVSYLAAASFWIYLVHHPIVGLVHLDLKWLFPGVNPIVKTAAAFAVTSGVCLLTYEGFVRRTALGRLLGFSWQRPLAAQQSGDVISIDSARGGQTPPRRSSRRAGRKAA